MSRILEQIEFYPPGLIIIRGPDEAAKFIQSVPREIIADLTSRGYYFLVLPVGASIETVPDDVLEQAYRTRQRTRKPVIRRAKDGMN